MNLSSKWKMLVVAEWCTPVLVTIDEPWGKLMNNQNSQDDLSKGKRNNVTLVPTSLLSLQGSITFIFYLSW